MSTLLTQTFEKIYAVYKNNSFKLWSSVINYDFQQQGRVTEKTAAEPNKTVKKVFGHQCNSNSNKSKLGNFWFKTQTNCATINILSKIKVYDLFFLKVPVTVRDKILMKQIKKKGI